MIDIPFEILAWGEWEGNVGDWDTRLCSLKLPESFLKFPSCQSLLQNAEQGTA